MNGIRAMVRPLACCLGLVLLASCASRDLSRYQLPPTFPINEDAGRGDNLVVMVRLEDGEELPFWLDTGAECTVLDASLRSKLGRQVDSIPVHLWGTNWEAQVYNAPKLYLGKIPLKVSGSGIVTLDLHGQMDFTGRRIMGVLGYDVLENYCIQIDFATRQLRFLDDTRPDKRVWGKAIPIIHPNPNDPRPAVDGNLAGVPGSCSLIDSGYMRDGWLRPKYFACWTNPASPGLDAHLPEGVFAGERYHEISLSEENVGSDGIGLSFLARHLVTLDFPNKTMYLKRTSVGRLKDSTGPGIFAFLKDLRDQGRLPGWARDERGTMLKTAMGSDSNSVLITVQKVSDSSIYRFQVVRMGKANQWQLRKALRLNPDGDVVEEIPLR